MSKTIKKYAHANMDKKAGLEHSTKRTKIVATIGPASDSYDAMVELVTAGVNVFRLNFSHGSYENICKHGINGLVIIGGDGSFRGAQIFSNEFDIPCIGLPGTIDKDISGTDFTIGFDTAVNTAVEAIDKIRDTADAHDRLFIIEVMGRDSGYIALHSGIATGAENILIPEKRTDIEDIINALAEKHGRKKLVNIIVVAEGEEFGANELSKIIIERMPDQEVRVCILGHIQRGGAPTCLDRLIASRMGYAAVECLMEERYNVFVGIVNNRMHYIPLNEAVKKKQKISEEWMKIVRILSS